MCHMLVHIYLDLCLNFSLFIAYILLYSLFEMLALVAIPLAVNHIQLRDAGMVGIPLHSR